MSMQKWRKAEWELMHMLLGALAGLLFLAYLVRLAYL